MKEAVSRSLKVLQLPALCRFGNDPYTELRIAAAEQMKITELRIWKLSKGSGGRSEGPLSVAERRAGQIRAQLGALAHHSCALSNLQETVVCSIAPPVNAALPWY